MLQTLGNTPVAATDSGDERIISSDDEEDDESPDSDTPATPASTLSRTQQSQLAQMVGDTMTRLNRLSEAVSYFEVARGLQDVPAARKEVARKIAALKATLRIERQNAARQPLLHEALEQDRVVRPRLLTRAAPLPKAATTTGGVKP